MEKRLQDFCQKCMAELKAIRESIKTLRGQGNQKQHSDNNQNNPDKKAKDVKIEGAIINTSVQAEIPVTKKHDSHADDPNNTKRENLRFIIEIVSAVLLFGYVVINCLLYIDTHISFRGSERPLFIVNHSGMFGLGGRMPHAHEDVVINLTNAGRGAAQVLASDAWLALIGDSIQMEAMPVARLKISGGETVPPNDDFHLVLKGITQAKIDALGMVPAMIQGRIIYSGMNDILKRSWLEEWASGPTQYCTSFCVSTSPGMAARTCNVVENLCDGKPHTFTLSGGPMPKR